MDDRSFESTWNTTQGFDYQAPPIEERGLCRYAAKFKGGVDKLFETHLETPDAVAINQVKILLLDSFFDARWEAPSAHRSVGGSRRGHRCLFSVFEDAYRKLREMGKDLDRPEFRRREIVQVPAPAPPAPRSRFDGIVLGELADDPSEFR